MKSISLGVVLVLLVLVSPIQSQSIGEISLTVGGVFPQGEYVKYADPGYSLAARPNFRMPGFETASLWLDFNFSEFSREETDIAIIAGPFILAGVQTISEQAYSIHGGLQLGSKTSRGFFRPRAAIGPGLFFFNTKTSVREEGATEDLASDIVTQTKFGWRGIIGADLFFNTKWGIVAEVTYDHVLSLNRTFEFDQSTGALIQDSQAAKFTSFMIGVVIPFTDSDEE